MLKILYIIWKEFIKSQRIICTTEFIFVPQKPTSDVTCLQNTPNTVLALCYQRKKLR